MKKLFAIALLALSVLTTFAQEHQILTSLTANTASNILTSASIIDNFTVLNATTNNATVAFYDSATTSTNYAQAAYTSYATYSTNFSVVFTNQNNVLVTNTFVGVATLPTSNSAATNSKPALITLIVPAGTVLNKDVKIQSMLGLTAVPSQNLTLVTTYRTPQ